MPRAQFNFDRNVQSAQVQMRTPRTPNVATPQISQGAIAQLGAGYAAFAHAIGQAGRDLGAAAHEHQAKQKSLGIKADEAEFNAYVDGLFMEREQQAAQTADPAEIDKAFEVTSALKEWITGTDAEDGPNIRWRDHETMLLEHLPAFEQKAKNMALKRKMAVDLKKTVAKAENSLASNTSAQNEAGVIDDTRTLGEAQGKSAEEIDLMLKNNLAAMNMAGIDNLLGTISSATADTLDERTAAAEEALKGFEYLGQDQRNLAKKQIAGARKAAVAGFEQAEMDRYNTDLFEGSMPENMTPKKLGEIYPQLSPEFKARWKAAYDGAARKPDEEEPVDLRESVGTGFELIAQAGNDPADGAVVHQQLKGLGLSKENCPLLFDAWSEKFDPQAESGAASGSYTNEKSISRARVADVMYRANEKGWGRKFSYGGGSKKDPDKDKLSEFNGVLAKEMDFYDTYTKDLMGKGKSWPEADAAYWELPKVKALTEKRDINGYLDKMNAALDAVDGVSKGGKIPAGNGPGSGKKAEPLSDEQSLFFDYILKPATKGL